MLIFITRNIGSWTGLYHAVESRNMVKLFQDEESGDEWIGVIGKGSFNLLTSNSALAGFVLKQDEYIELQLRKAVVYFETAGLPYTDENGNIYSVGEPIYPWARFTISIELGQ